MDGWTEDVHNFDEPSPSQAKLQDGKPLEPPHDVLPQSPTEAVLSA